MKLKKRLLKFYFFTAIIPTIVITLLLSVLQYHNLVSERIEQAENRANILAETIDSYVMEITTRLELMASLIDEADEGSIQNILSVMAEKYPYASEFYFANIDGIIYLASTTLTESIDIHFRPYFNTVMTTGETALFFAKDSALNDYIPLITVAAPVFVNEGEISGVLIGDIPPESILNQRPALRNMTNYILRDDVTNTNILDYTDGPSTNTVFTSLEEAPWTVAVNVQYVTNHEIIFHILIILFICILLTHLLYFVIRFFYEKKKLEDEQQKNTMKKLELVGTLAGTFAHEIRNPLTGIIGFVELLKGKHLDEDDQMYYSVIETELTRINNIVGEFLILGKPIVVNQKIYDIKDIIKEVYLVIEPEAHHYGVSANIELADSPLALYCSKDHIKQLVLNLAKNAIQASEAGGQVTITAKKNKDFIFISVIDSGCGIPDEIKDTLFEPFVTTKDEGTGLGLIVCKQITEMYGGTIEVNSTINVGTTFLIAFPLKRTS